MGDRDLFKGTFQIYNQAFIISFLPQSPGISHAPPQLPDPTMMQTDEVPETLAEFPSCETDTTTCRPDRLQKSHQSTVFLRKIVLDSHMKVPGSTPIVMKQSARQQLFGLFLFISLLTLFHISTNFPNSKVTTQQSFSKSVV